MIQIPSHHKKSRETSLPILIAEGRSVARSHGVVGYHDRSAFVFAGGVGFNSQHVQPFLVYFASTPFALTKIHELSRIAVRYQATIVQAWGMQECAFCGSTAVFYKIRTLVGILSRHDLYLPTISGWTCK